VLAPVSHGLELAERCIEGFSAFARVLVFLDFIVINEPELLGERPLATSRMSSICTESVSCVPLSKSEIDGLLLGGARHATRLPVKFEASPLCRIRLAVDCVIGCSRTSPSTIVKVLVWLINRERRVGIFRAPCCGFIGIGVGRPCG